MNNGRNTLTDGTVIITPEGNDWIGKSITLENGVPLPPGEYELVSGPHSSGGIIIIGRNGNVQEVREPAMIAGVKNNSRRLYDGRITLEEFRRIELAKLPENKRLAIDQLSKKVEELKKIS